MWLYVEGLLFCCLLADYCALPSDQGNCTERLPRWFFNPSENKCMPFYYSGCGGNSNRFETQKACEADCPPKVGEFSQVFAVLYLALMLEVAQDAISFLFW
jgi:hypothetical protein